MEKGSAIRGAMHRLTPLEVLRAGDGDYSDGGGLVLRIAGGLGSFTLRYTAPTGKRRELGLGKLVRTNQAASGKSLRDAREAAEDARRLLRQGIDPIEARKARRAQAQHDEAARREAARREAATLARVSRDYHERVIAGARTPKHAAQWLASLENHVPADLWHKPIVDITGPELADFLIGLQRRIPETAGRVRQRLEAIFDDAEFRGLSTGNPARAARRKVQEAGNRRVRGAFAALPYRDVPAFMKRLREREGIAARALEFAVLTAARTGEVIGATWAEFDTEARLWRIPAERMKAGQAHDVYLSGRALDILAATRELKQDFVFPGPKLDGRPMSNMAMLALLRRMDAAKETTVHGLARASFSTWAHETAAARPDVIEACLAHREADRVAAAYNRAQFAAERAALLQRWAEYLDGVQPSAEVIPLVQGRA